MKLPRDFSGMQLAKALAKRGYSISHQTGSHLRLTTHLEGEHHVTIPNHSELRIGTLHSILREVAAHAGLSRDELLKELFS